MAVACIAGRENPVLLLPESVYQILISGGDGMNGINYLLTIIL